MNNNLLKEMKVKIKSFNGELPSYLTVGKVYDAEMESKTGGKIINDDGEKIYIFTPSCSHLNDGSWEVVE